MEKQGKIVKQTEKKEPYREIKREQTRESSERQSVRAKLQEYQRISKFEEKGRTRALTKPEIRS